MGLLFQIQNDVQSIAEVIAEALKVETEIVDKDGTVIGATGRIRGQLLTNRTDTFINQYVIQSARTFVLENPGQHRLCASCSEKEDCIYTGGLFYPINVNGICEGVISLVSFTQQQKHILLINQVSFLDFIGKMADFLATKISEKTMIKYLKTIIDSVCEGIVACDVNGTITCFNHTAEKTLGISSENAIGQHISKIIPNSLINKSLTKQKSIYDEKVSYNNSHGDIINLVSNATLIANGPSILGAVESFTEEDMIVRAAYRLSSNEQASAFDKIIGNSKSIKSVKSKASKIARSNSTILITGESGTGKELFARAIHSASCRAKEPFIAINCGAIPDSLLESELFGYDRGAFTGANREGKPGKFELANKGTVFLDEVGDMPLHLQVKILRVLQEKVIQRVGGTKDIPVDVRIIAATHQNLRELVEKRLFREDLYYRLNVIPIHIPPLRERPDDIPVLIEYLFSKFPKIMGKNILGFTKEALETLKNYTWPGNVRELENAIEYAVNFCPNEEMISQEYLPPWLTDSAAPISDEDFKQKLEQSEIELLKDALQKMGRSLEAKEQIAKKLGISVSTLYRKLRKYNIE